MSKNSEISDLQSELGRCENVINNQRTVIDDQSAVISQQNCVIEQQKAKIQDTMVTCLEVLHEASESAAVAIRQLVENHAKDILQLKAAADCAIQEAKGEAIWTCFRYVADLLANGTETSTVTVHEVH